jgi:hypothetical protein
MPDEISALSNKNKAKIIRAHWKAMLEPPWTSDDLIDLGKALFAKTKLEDLARQDEAKFNRLLPLLDKMAECLWTELGPIFPATGTAIPTATPATVAIPVTTPTAAPAATPAATTAPPSKMEPSEG